jgi:amidophosphoribosyltransferase
MHKIQGAYSLVIMGEDELIGVRDPFGFRPLCLGKLTWTEPVPAGPGAGAAPRPQTHTAYVLASETCALDLIQAEFIRDLDPGEIVVVNKDGVRSVNPWAGTLQPHAFCIFEYVYFARPDSRVLGHTVAEVRVNLGRALAREHPVEADLVIPVPDSGVCAAMGYSEESGIPFEMAFIRNHYVGRSFLQPTQLIRDFDVRVKLNLIASLVKDKRVIIVDDSIVRGTTCKTRVKTLKEAGAKEVHVAVSCPPHTNPCVYGIDFPDRTKLMAANNTVDEIRKYLNADSLHYLSQAGMVKATGLAKEGFCMACYDGNYPVPFDPVLDKHIIERRKRQAQTLGEAVEKDSEQIKLLQV